MTIPFTSPQWQNVIQGDLIRGFLLDTLDCFFRGTFSK